MTVTDKEDISHGIVVMASSLYEAVAKGIMAMCGREWVGELAQGLSIDVRVSEVMPVAYSVKIQDFKNWLERTPRSPKDMVTRNQVREILGSTENRKR